MPAQVNLGNYDIDEDSNGNLVIKDSTGTTVLTHTDSGGWALGANFDSGGNDITNVAALDSSSVSTDDLTDGGGISHTGRLADLGESFLASYDKSVGGGSVTDNSGVVELREPGNASATSGSRIYSHIFEFDPSQSRLIRINIQDVTIDNQTNARIRIQIGNNPDVRGDPGNDFLGGVISGDGQVLAVASDDGSAESKRDSSQDNAYVSGLNSIEISWDGSTVTVTTDDGSTTVTKSLSKNYPSGETLHLKIGADDGDGSNGRNVDFDVNSVVIDQ